MDAIWLLRTGKEKFLENCRKYKNWKKILRSVKSWVVPNVLDGEPITPKNWHLHVAINYPSFLRTQAVNERYLKILINPIFIWTYPLLNSGYSWTYAIKLKKIQAGVSGRIWNLFWFFIENECKWLLSFSRFLTYAKSFLYFHSDLHFFTL